MSYPLNSMTYSLSEQLQIAVQTWLAEWQKQDKIFRLWTHDPSLWANEDEAKWLGWLEVVGAQFARIDEIENFQSKVKARGFAHILLLGMGGSSLCPEVLSMTYGKRPGFPELLILDSTVPAQVKAVESKIDLENTLFIVASKSGSTLEPNCFKQYFYEQVAEKVGRDNAGKQFVAITDPGSKMQQVAEAGGFWKIFFGNPEIGGRFSALSDFGMIPAAAMGLNVREFLARAQEMVYACKRHIPTDNSGVELGIVLGACHAAGRDKLTIFTSPGVHDLGAWLEQLVAESTGKHGVAIIPVDREEIQTPDGYGNDRIFAYLNLAGENEHDAAVTALEQSGHSVVRITLQDKMNLGQEFFRWEVATAVVGSLMQINPFNQPDVEAAKIEARKITDEYEQKGSLPDETPFFEEGGIKLFTDEANAAEIQDVAGTNQSVAGYLKAHLSRIKPGDYFALLGYIEMNAGNENLLGQIRHSVLKKHHVATCLGFGPRFLHSTGQAYKGGANNGVFLQITSDDEFDIPVPGQKYTFGVVKAAQSRGDFQVLVDRNRRALRIHLSNTNLLTNLPEFVS